MKIFSNYKGGHEIFSDDRSLKKVKNAKFSGASPIDPIGELTAPPTPSCCKLAKLPTGAPLVLISQFTFEIRRLIILFRHSLCSKPEPKFPLIFFKERTQLTIFLMRFLTRTIPTIPRNGQNLLSGTKISPDGPIVGFLWFGNFL